MKLSTAFKSPKYLEQSADSAHEYCLSYEPSYDACKVCHRSIAGSGYVCL